MESSERRVALAGGLVRRVGPKVSSSFSRDERFQDESDEEIAAVTAETLRTPSRHEIEQGQEKRGNAPAS